MFTPVIPPSVEASAPPSMEPSVPAAWRSEAVLIMRPSATLPDACFRCGRPSQSAPLRARVSWHHPWLYLLLLQPVVYLLATLVSGKRHRIRLPFCARHRRRRTWARVLGWSLVPSGCAAIVYGLVQESLAIALAGLYVALASAVVAAIEARIGVVRIDSYFVRLRGADLLLLDQLPDWDGYPEWPR